VYDPALLPLDARSSDATSADVSASDVLDAAPDVPIDSPPDAPRDAASDADSARDAASEASPDARDAALPGCPGVLARGEPCIEPVLGEGFTAQTPELIAPDALVVRSELPLVAYVGDSATGRVFEVRETMGGLAINLVAGVNVAAPLSSAGLARERPLESISGLTLQSGGGSILLGADPEGNRAFRLSVNSDLAASTIENIPLSAPAPLTGPFDVEQAAGGLVFSANNAVQLTNMTGASVIAGSSCAQSFGCEGFNSVAVPPLMSRFARPGAIEVARTTSPETLYVVDQGNCRVRRFQGPPSAANLEVVAGAGCSAVGSIHDGAAPPPLAAAARFGPLGALALSRNRFLFVSDPVARCSIFSVDLQPASPTVRLVAGHGGFCGEVARTGGAYRLGRLGGMAVGPTTFSLYFIDAQARLLYRAEVSPTGVPGSVVLVGSLGRTRGTEPLPLLRSGGVRALTPITAPPAAGGLPEFLWSAPREDRVFGLRDRALRVAVGLGNTPPTVAILSSAMESAEVSSIATPPTLTGRSDALLAVRDKHVILRLAGDAVSVAAGQYGVSGNPGATGILSAFRLDDPSALTMADTNTAYVASRRPNGGYLVYLLTFSSASFSTLFGLGPTEPGTGDAPLTGAPVAASRLRMLAVSAIAYSASRAEIFVADPEQHAVFRVATRAGSLQASLLAGNYTENTALLLDDSRLDGQPATNVALPSPSALAVDPAGTTLYVADSSANRVLAIDLVAATPTVRRVAGSGSLDPIPLPSGDNGAARSAQLASPTALAFVPPTTTSGAALLVGEGASGRIRIVRFPR
jgi:hypothetical protein